MCCCPMKRCLPRSLRGESSARLNRRRSRATESRIHEHLPYGCGGLYWRHARQSSEAGGARCSWLGAHPGKAGRLSVAGIEPVLGYLDSADRLASGGQAGGRGRSTPRIATVAALSRPCWSDCGVRAIPSFIPMDGPSITPAMTGAPTLEVRNLHRRNRQLLAESMSPGARSVEKIGRQWRSPATSAKVNSRCPFAR